MEHIYRGFRISLRQAEGGWHAKFWRVSGAPVMLAASASGTDGCDACLVLAKEAVDRFLAYIGQTPAD